MKRHIPNTITLLNLFFGCLSIVFALKGELLIASAFIAGGAVADFFDGMAARLLNVKSIIGKELDSLADVVTFGVAPSVIAYSLILYDTNKLFNGIEFVAFLMAMFSALRLAKFNIDERQTDNFIGMPTPANAMFWASLPLIIKTWNISISEIHLLYLYVIFFVFLFSYLLVCEIPMMSFKFKNLSWKDNKNRYIFLMFAVILYTLLGMLMIPLVVLLYPVFSLIFRPKMKKDTH